MSRHHRIGNGAAPNDNIVLVTIDSLRADHCGFLDGDEDLTPTIDSLATNGVVFERAIAPGPRTPSSMPVAFTGYFDLPWEFSWGAWDHRRGRISTHMQRHQTLAGELKRAGYTTIGITVNPWTHGTGFDHGFDRFIEITGRSVTERRSRTAPLMSTLDAVFSRTRVGEKYQWRLTKDWLVQWHHYYDTILEEINTVSGPYFLWVFLLDPHQPYLAPRRYRTDSTLPTMYYANFRESTGNIDDDGFPDSVKRMLHHAYRDAVRSADGFLGQLLDDVDSTPTVIVHADHGEAFGEHGTWGHRAELYQENLHVPLVIHDGVHRSNEEEVLSLRKLRDIVIATAHGSVDPSTYTGGDVMAATEGLTKRALFVDEWKYIDTGDRELLFNLETDPTESDDLSADRPEITSLLSGRLNQRRVADTERAHIREAASHEERQTVG